MNFSDYSSFLNNPYLTAVISKRDRNYAIKNNRVKFIESLKINSETIIFPQQVHSNNVKIIDKVKIYKETDGLLSLSSNLGIGILVADCVPVFLYATKSNHYGLIHSGWRGSANLITTNAIKKLIDLGNYPSEIKAVLGPSIGKCCFDIGRDVVQYFSQENLFLEKGAKYKLDLKNEIFSELINLGLTVKNIYLDSHCTFCNEEKFFSYRREGINSGRMVAIMKVKTL